ncbi:hypothetical protein J4H27_22820 [Vibrio alginolyticus]|uniref:hypothetical protein n=1 Tax=Vibrio alginolyticus TaxID=663 RepID=UPI001BD2D033|nr:hypothetical protein [Vibrio alginolyticus]MBS9944764.1 hypothetical protein [Vibrio alginolyticus]HCH1012852.1 hypothetical protein [Vibrio parahaemolyticus]HCH1833005.1 hypothetical protein [Vibrio parahaemolyticus]
MSNLYTIKEACDHFGITRKTLFNWRKANRIKTIETEEGVFVDVSTERSVMRQKLPSNNLDLLSLIQELHTKIDNLTQELHDIKQHVCNEGVKHTPHDTQDLPIKGANEARQQQAIDKARAKFLELGSPKISRAELARQAGVDRNTVGKHWAIITQLELDVDN